MKSRILVVAGAVLAPLLLALVAGMAMLVMRQGGLQPFRVPTAGSTPRSSAELLERGRHLATLGNCAGCHTARGGVPMAGGRAFRTRYGTVYSSNISPDLEHGIGAWSSEEFRHAMRHGVSRNGVLSPVFPWASFRHLGDEDLDALLAHLRSLPASSAPRLPAAYEFPANLPGAMTAWRLLYFRPTALTVSADPAISRGAWLVEGIGHCATCHASRGAFASQAAGHQLWGARAGGWFAPALHGPALARHADGDVARYLRGEAPGDLASYGLMADVIAGNLQFLAADEADAIEKYLRSLPAPPPSREAPPRARASSESLASGRAVYAEHCAECHGDAGEGIAGKYPSLHGSTAIAAGDPVNLVKLVLFGAVAPGTKGNPMPYTMPPFGQSLGAGKVADLANFLRGQENADAWPVSAEDVGAMGGIE